MRREGTDENNAVMSDFSCDFCASEWVADLPMVEGHKGSLICGACLREACRRVLVRGESTAGAGYACTLCLLTKSEPAWESPSRGGAVICHWCINKSAGMLEKDPDFGWKRPEAPGSG